MFVLISILVVLLLFVKSKRSLHMLQQNLYNENNRYIKWNIKNISQFLNLEIIIVILSSIALFVMYDMRLYNLIIKITICLIYIIRIIKLRSDMKKEKTKKPLVYTKRIKRLIFTTSVLYLVVLALMFLNKDEEKTLWILTLILTTSTYLNPLIVFIANIINKPIEKLVYLYYKTKAQNKLKSMPNLKIIGITGSYGKTSSKNILSDILNIKYNALPTPKNLNTYNGLIMTVNNNMDKFTEIFIAEMGAYVKGEIKGLCKLVKPQYGILTRIGTAHLESFGSEQNIIDGKFELIESLPSDGVGVLNRDDPKQVNYNLKNDCKILWIGIDEEDVDVRATNIKCSYKGTTFDVVLKNSDKKYKFETKLLGNHNVYNILAGIALGLYFGIDMEELVMAVKGVKPVEHRLEIKRIGNFFMIDDAYNSNPTGAESAVNVLSMMPGVKIVVTPGMIELGKKEDEYNEIFGQQISEVADYVVLVGEEKTRPILQGLKTKNFDLDKVVVYNDVREAYKFINTISSNTDKEVYALFENDLPDTYNEK
ncbi:MAG: UDP-N-acetylmuramoyl-tripeptide--D-alanyl-D-alanine ligase [Bacilli bacterium]|nr:UDP-N-acetylmuramoyl-tripeptide--D-alanyl-D-alanine ligase [Bacilli bacterium]